MNNISCIHCHWLEVCLEVGFQIARPKGLESGLVSSMFLRRIEEIEKLPIFSPFEPFFGIFEPLYI